MDVLTVKPENIGIDSAIPAERDRIDLNHEMAGLDNGRLKRFLSESAISYSGETKKEKSKREFQTLLDIPIDVGNTILIQVHR